MDERRVAILMCMVAGFACGEEMEPPVDAGVVRDAGTRDGGVVERDAGTPDTGVVRDGGPPPCLELDVAQTDLVLAELEPQEFIVVYNPTDTDIDINEDDPDYQLAQVVNSQLDMDSATGYDIVVPARSYRRMDFPGFVDEVDAGGNLALFSSFLHRPQFLLDYVCWGAINAENLKMMAEQNPVHWTGDCLAAVPEGLSIQRVPGSDGLGAASYVIGPPIGRDCTAP